MQYQKKATTIAEQIELLKERGLIFKSEEKAANYLSNISYYRLRAYTYPFQDETDDSHPFKKEITFEQILDLYIFDRKLRIIVFDAIEKIEVALRTKLTYHYSLKFGSHWHETANLYLNNTDFIKDIDDLYKEVDRSTETFIKHYKSKYTTPKYPACWMSLEVASMGSLSKIFKNLKNCEQKKGVYSDFGIKDYEVMESWFHAICHVRNVCAHHGRLWNRRFTAKPILPKSPTYQFLLNRNINTNKLYAMLSCIVYILNIISPNHTFVAKIKELFKLSSLVSLKEMGFPKDWEKEPIWG